MKWVVAGLLGASIGLGSSALCAAPFVNATDAKRPPPRPASLEEPPPDETPRSYDANRYAPSAPEAAPRARHESFTLLLSPIYLLLPMLKITAEVKPASHLGLAVFGGVGRTSIDVSSSDGTKRSFDANLYSVGGQVIGYPLRSFDGLELGAQFQYVHVDTQGTGADASVAGIGSGVALGPFVGYKWITRVGFTFLLQGGVQFLAVEANANDNAGNSASASENRVGPLLNADLGWSF